MPYLMGSCPEEDLRWQRFLTASSLSSAQRSTLLLSVASPSNGDYESPFNAFDAWCRAEPPCGGHSDLFQVLREQPEPTLEKLWHRVFNSQQVFIVHRGEPAYPPLLNHCADAPPALFCQGDLTLLLRPAIAVVGSRRPSRDGGAAAYELAARLADHGMTVVSGLARGIDGFAHAGALSAGGTTVGVMATGLDRIYPTIHKKLATSIASQGLLVTEFPPYVNPERWHFPRRNRTLSGLCLGTVVVEAGRPSGSLLTASAAAEQGRDVFAYPWSVYHKGGEGCRYLLGDGAQLAQCAEDVLLGLSTIGISDSGQSGHAKQRRRDPVALASRSAKKPIQGAVIGDSTPPSPVVEAMASHLQDQHIAREAALTVPEILGDAELGVPELCRLTGRSPSDLAVELARLEIAGVVVSTPIGFRLKRAEFTQYPC